MRRLFHQYFSRVGARERAIAIGVTVLLFMLVQVPTVLVSGAAARKHAIDVAQASIERIGDTTVQSVLRHMAPAERSAEILAELLEGDTAGVQSPVLEKLLRAQLGTAPQISHAYVGFPDGSFSLVGREGEGFRIQKTVMSSGKREVEIVHTDKEFHPISVERPPGDTYDPRQRPWYKLALSSARGVWTDPYIFHSPPEPGITAARAVRAGGALVGVVGIDMQLNGLAEFLSSLAVAKSGEAFVVSGQSVVAAPTRYAVKPGRMADGSLRLPNLDEFGLASLVDATAASPQHAPAADAQKDIVVRRALSDGSFAKWSLLVRAHEAEFTQAVNAQQRRMLALLLGGGLVALAGMLFTLVWLMRPLTAELEREAEERHRAEASLVAAKDGLSGLTRQLLAQERTLTSRIAQSLHDQLGQSLAAARLRLDALLSHHRETLPAAVSQDAQRLSGLLNQAVHQVRQVLVELRPSLLHEHGLAAALDNEIRTRSIDGVTPSMTIDASGVPATHRWPGDVEYSAFMVAREAMANAIQHAHAKHIQITLRKEGAALVLDIADDGLGFESSDYRTEPGHLGLIGMRERALAIDAYLNVESSPASGTRVRLQWEPQVR